MASAGSSPSSPGPMLLELTGMAYGGDAIGRDEQGRLIFVPYALPGERVRARIQEDHRTWARAHLVEVVRPSTQRVTPRCPHFGVCGGCHYQHLDYSAQLDVKRAVVREQLERLGRFRDPPVQPATSSPSPWHTRNHMQFSVTNEGRLGLLQARSHQPIAIEECHLPEPPIADLWPRLDLDPIPGLERVSVRSGADDDCLVIFEARDAPEADVVVDLPASVLWYAGDTPSVLAGQDHLTIEVLGRPFRVSSDSFFQVHTSLAGDLVGLALEAVPLEPGQLVLDVYAGVGLFSAFFAERGARVVAIEQAPGACLDFEANLETFDDVSLYEASADQALGAISARPAAVVVDPPRSGVGAQTLARLAALQPARILYVSCDPATLARDGRTLTELGFALRSLTPVDMFPQTYHIETVSLWMPEDHA